MILTRGNSTVIILTMFMLLATQSKAYVQHDTSDTKPTLAWLNLGLGIYSSQGLSGGISVSGCFRNSLVSVRYVNNSEFTLFKNLDETVWDLGILYGTSAKASYGMASISGGIALVGGVRRGKLLARGFLSEEYEAVKFSAVGFSIESQLFWTPDPSLGVGIYAFGNINGEQSFAGALLCLQIGALR